MNYVRCVLSLGVGAVTGDQIILFPNVNTIPTTTPRKADGNVIVNGVTVFIFEVESNSSWYNTTLKLAIHLSQMLASLRNRSSMLGVSLSASVHSLSGFYFPNKKNECVVEVCVHWNDDILRFVESHTMILTVGEVKRRLKSVYQRNKSLWENSSLDLTEFCYPLTPHYLTNFAADAKQVDSGQSVVIVCENDCLVYKYPMNSSERSNISSFRGERLDQVGFPLMELKRINSIKFLKYDMYSDLPPVSIIKDHAVWFVRSLVQAVESLHVLGFAHLDIRLENICMNDNQQIVLIDLDRSASKQLLALCLKNRYPRSVNYQPPPDDQSWTSENLDWKQVGLLLSGVFPRPHSSKTIRFLSDLKGNGEIYIHPNLLHVILSL